MENKILSTKSAGQPDNLDVIPEPAHPTKSMKVANYVIAVALVVIALSLGVFLKWSFADTSVLEVRNSPFPARIVPDTSGKTGGIVFLNADYCKNSSLEGTIRISYVSASREVFLPITPEKLPKGCDNSEVPVIVPKDLAADTYKIKFRVTYDINPIKQDVITDFESQPFKVAQ